jgi:hypothetical protein
MAKRTNDQRDAVIDDLLERVAKLEAMDRRERKQERQEARQGRRQRKDKDALASTSIRLEPSVQTVRGRGGKFVRRVVNPR